MQVKFNSGIGAQTSRKQYTVEQKLSIYFYQFWIVYSNRDIQFVQIENFFRFYFNEKMVTNMYKNLVVSSSFDVLKEIIQNKIKWKQARKNDEGNLQNDMADIQSNTVLVPL